jgi:hypothetical protein
MCETRGGDGVDSFVSAIVGIAGTHDLDKFRHSQFLESPASDSK